MVKKIIEKTNYIKTFIKGFAMGTSDVVPGVSGGTIAFITGIYEKFIHSIKNFTTKEFIQMKLKFLKGDFKGFKKDFIELGFNFLFTLLFGLFLAIFVMSKLLLYLLSTYQSFTLSFFVGLIIASILFIKKEIKHHNTQNYLVAGIGLLCGLSLIFLNTTNMLSAPLYYIGLGGFLAISAMFLPGISGSFILYVLGLYNIVYGAIHNITRDWKILVSFAIGAIFGAIFISRLIDYLFRVDKSKTLYFLLGLVVGALAVPIQTIFVISSFTLIESLLILFFIVLGFTIVFVIEKISKRIEKNKK